MVKRLLTLLLAITRATGFTSHVSVSESVASFKFGDAVDDDWDKE